jgi:hypothetical protein
MRVSVLPNPAAPLRDAMLGSEVPASRTARRSPVPVLLALLFATAIMVGAHFSLRDRMLARATMLRGVCLVLWLFEVIPLYATTLVLWAGMVFLLGPLDPVSFSLPRVVGSATNPVMILFFGGFVLSVAGAKYGIDAYIAGWMVKASGGRKRVLLFSTITVTAVLSMWMLNTAAVAMMLATLRPLFDRDQEDRASRLSGPRNNLDVGGLRPTDGRRPRAPSVGRRALSRRRRARCGGCRRSHDSREDFDAFAPAVHLPRPTRILRLISALLKSVVDGESQQLGAALEVHLLLNVLAMGLNRFHTYEKVVRDLAHPFALAEKLEYLKFPIGQDVGGAGATGERAAGHLVEDGRRHLLAYENLPGQDASDRDDHLFRGLLLGQVTPCPGTKRSLAVHRFIVHREHQDGQFWMTFLELLNQLDPVCILERDVDDGEIRSKRFNGFDRFA